MPHQVTFSLTNIFCATKNTDSHLLSPYSYSLNLYALCLKNNRFSVQKSSLSWSLSWHFKCICHCYCHRRYRCYIIGDEILVSDHSGSFDMSLLEGRDLIILLPAGTGDRPDHRGRGHIWLTPFYTHFCTLITGPVVQPWSTPLCLWRPNKQSSFHISLFSVIRPASIRVKPVFWIRLRTDPVPDGSGLF